MINKVMIGLAAVAFVSIPAIVGAVTAAKGRTEMASSERATGQPAMQPERKPSAYAKPKAYGYVKHKPATHGYSKGRAKGQ